MSTPSDEAALLERWRAGGEEAGTRLVTPHSEAVLRFFRGKVESGADDMAQRTIRACIATPPKPEYGGTVRSYLLAIARHVLINHIKKERQLAEKPHLVGAFPLDQLQPGASGPEEQAELRIVAAALRRLPLDLQIILEIARWEEAGSDELAKILEVPESTVERRLWRAETRLEREVEATTDDPARIRRTLEDLDGWLKRLGAARVRVTGF